MPTKAEPTQAQTPAAQAPAAAPAASRIENTHPAIAAFGKRLIGDRYDKYSAATDEADHAAERMADGKTGEGGPLNQPASDKNKGKPQQAAPGKGKDNGKDKGGRGAKEERQAAPQRDSTGKFRARGTPSETPTQPITADQIAAAAADGVARAMLDREAKGAAPEPKAPELDRKTQRKVDVLNRMAEKWPDEYKGLSQKFLDSSKKEKEYREKWESEHPGEEFNAEDPEHNDFYTKNDVDWDDDDFVEAAADIRARAAQDEVKKDIDSKLEGLTLAEKRRQSEHLINAQQTSAAQTFWQIVDENLADLVDGTGRVNNAKLAELQQTNPDAARIYLDLARTLDQEVATIYALYNRLEQNDPDHNELHKVINTFVVTKERQMAGMVTQDKLDQKGRMFLPMAQYVRIPKAERDEKYWSFTDQDIALLRAKDLADQARAKYQSAEEGHRNWARARGLQLEDPNEKPNVPTLGGGEGGGESRVAAEAVVTPKQPDAPLSGFKQRMLGSK